MKISRRQFLETLAASSLATSALLLPQSTQAQQITYTPEHLLKREFDHREAQWRENIIRSQNNQTPVDYTNIPLSSEYDLNDLIAVLGGEWDVMPQQRKDTTFRSWITTPQNNRRTICEIQKNPFKYFLKLSPEQQNQFNELNAAYLHAIKHYDHPSSLIFATSDGSTTNYFARHYPWIWLDMPSVPNRMIIYRQGYIDNPQAARLNFRSIKALANQAFSEGAQERQRALQRQ